MAIQMYLVQLKDGESDADRESIAGFIARLQGFVLMATSAGSLIVAFDEQHLSAVKGHHVVDFVGGVSFNPDGPLVAKLQHLFAQNVASQLAERGATAAFEERAQTPGESSAGHESSFPPGYRPIRWPKS